MNYENESELRILDEQELSAVGGGMRRRLRSQVSPSQGPTKVYVDDGVNLSTSNPAASNIEINLV